jgi:sugar phosphate isomerase/epimerase
VCRNDPVDLGPGQKPTAYEHRRDAARVADVRQRVGFEQHQVRTLADVDRALVPQPVEVEGRIEFLERGSAMLRTVNRREFLERTTVSGLGAAALALLTPREIARAQSGMFVSLPPWAVARNVGWPEQARLAARVGYAGIDWAFGPARTAGVEATRALLAELKIRATIVNLPMQAPLDGDEAAFTAQLPKLAEDAAFCAAIGCRNFQLVLRATTGGPSREERWKVVRARLAAIAEVLMKHDVRLGLEFLGPLVFRTRAGGGRGRGAGPPVDPNAPPPPPPAPPVPFVWTLPETVKLGAESGPNVGATLDAWHWYHSGGTVADIVATPSSRIIHVHVSDARAMPPEEVQDNMRFLPGEGIIDLVGFFTALRQIGYRGGVAPETIGPRIPDTMPPEESARLALEATVGVMKKAGVM